MGVRRSFFYSWGTMARDSRFRVLDCASIRVHRSSFLRSRGLDDGGGGVRYLLKTCRLRILDSGSHIANITSHLIDIAHLWIQPPISSTSTLTWALPVPEPSRPPPSCSSPKKNSLHAGELTDPPGLYESGVGELSRGGLDARRESGRFLRCAGVVIVRDGQNIKDKTGKSGFGFGYRRGSE